MRTAKRACALGALGLLLSACGTTPTGTGGNPTIAVDDRGLAMFDFGPQGFDSLLKEDFGKLTKQQKSVRAATLLLLERVLVPAAHETGLVAAEKLMSGVGWHCARPGIRVLPDADADLKVASAHLSGMVNIRNTLPELTALDWFIEMRKYVANRFKRYESCRQGGRGRRIPGQGNGVDFVDESHSWRYGREGKGAGAVAKTHAGGRARLGCVPHEPCGNGGAQRPDPQDH